MHTFYSDGTCSPKQNVIDSALIGMNVIAITDHDITEGYFEAKEEAKKWGIEVLTGVEISTTKYHILGYGFDIGNKGLQELLKYSRKCQEEIVKERVEKIASLGIPLNFEKIKTLFPESRLGKYNILMTLILDEGCRKYNGIINKPSEEVFEEYLGKGSIGGKGDYDFKEQVKSKEAIDIIHDSGGIAILAHPFKEIDYSDEKERIRSLEKMVKKGIDGLEVQPNYGDKNSFFKKYANENNLLVTYGSDFHGARYLKRPLLSRNGNLVEKFW